MVFFLFALFCCCVWFFRPNLIATHTRKFFCHIEFLNPSFFVENKLVGRSSKQCMPLRFYPKTVWEQVCCISESNVTAALLADAALYRFWQNSPYCTLCLLLVLVFGDAIYQLLVQALAPIAGRSAPYTLHI